MSLSRACVHRLPIPTFLHMPLAYEHYLQQQYRYLQQLELEERWPGFVLTQTGFLGGAILRLLQDTESPSHHVTRLPSDFTLNVVLHQGDIGTIKQAVRSQQMALLDQAKMPKELFLSYLTCPQCQKDRGGAKILLLRRWQKSSRLQKKVQR